MKMKKQFKSSFKDKVMKDAERQQSRASSYGYLSLPKGVQVYSPEPGSRVTLDFLPYVVTDDRHPDRDPEREIAMPDTLWYKRPFKVHRNIGAANDSVICPTSVGKRCPICEYRAKLMKEGAEKESTDALKPSLRNLYVVVPLGDKKYEEKPHVFDISQYLFQGLLNEELEENEDYGVFPDLEEGLTLKIRFESRTIGKGQPFAEASRIDFLQREEQYTEEILKEVPSLDNLLHILSYEEIEARFFEVDTEEAGGKLKEDVAPTIRRGIGKEEEEEEEEEESTPKRSVTRTPSRTTTPIRRVVEKEEEEAPTRKVKEEEEEPVPVNKTRETVSASEQTSSKGKCPYGHRFGADVSAFDDCDICEIWDECYETGRKKK